MGALLLRPQGVIACGVSGDGGSTKGSEKNDFETFRVPVAEGVRETSSAPGSARTLHVSLMLLASVEWALDGMIRRDPPAMAMTSASTVAPASP